MSSSHRSEDAIRTDIAAEREQLADALAALRRSVDEKRRIGMLIAAILGVFLVLLLVGRLLRT